MDASFFDRPIERRGTASFKWDLYGGDVLPLWVADMDFAAPPPVVEALEACVAHGVFGPHETTQNLLQRAQRRKVLRAIVAGSTDLPSHTQ